MQLQKPVSILKRGSHQSPSRPMMMCQQLNHDSDPVIVNKRSKIDVEYTQEFCVRYLKPPTPPPPGDIVINELDSYCPPPPPALITSSAEAASNAAADCN